MFDYDRSEGWAGDAGNGPGEGVGPGVFADVVLFCTLQDERADEGHGQITMGMSFMWGP